MHLEQRLNKAPAASGVLVVASHRAGALVHLAAQLRPQPPSLLRPRVGACGRPASEWSGLIQGINRDPTTLVWKHIL